MSHPWAGVAIAGVHNTVQARSLPGETIRSLMIDAITGACADAGIPVGELDGVVGEHTGEITYDLGLGPASTLPATRGVLAVRQAASLIASGECRAVVVAAAGAAIHRSGPSTAPWTRPANELVMPFGMFTAAEFALMARRHMLDHGTTPDQLAEVAATIRNNGSANPGAVYSGRGPFTAADILASPMVADPFHLLDCATTSEGGCALVLVDAARAADLPGPPSFILGAGSDSYGSAYRQAPSWDMGPTSHPAGMVGRRAAAAAFAQAGLGPDDVDVCEFYDPFSFEIIRQFEAFGFCAEGEGGDFALAHMGPEGRWPVTTDGGTMSFSHPGILAQQLQRIIRAAEQVRGTCTSMQVADAEVAICSNGGSGALFNDVMLVGSTAP